MDKTIYNLTRVFSLRDKIFDKIATYSGTKISGGEFDRFVADLTTTFDESVLYSTAYQSATYLIDTELTSRLLLELSWRLAGNIDKLKSNKPVLPWIAQPKTETVPVQILEATKTHTFNGGIGYQYKMRILSGTSCPIVIYPLWSLNMVKYVSSKIGFTPSWKAHPFKDGSELVNMRLLAAIDPQFCRNNQPGFRQVSMAPSLLKWNKELLLARAHTDPPCPMDFTHYCYVCPVGYKDCIAGTHPYTYVKQHCVMCDKETWHNPSNNTCVTCVGRKG